MRTYAFGALSLALLSCSSTSHSDLSPRADTGLPTKATDASYEAPATPVDVFDGVAAFVAKTAVDGASLASRHKSHTGATLTGTDCGPCHDGTNSNKEAVKLAFGGTVYFAPDAKEVAAGVEVRVVDATGKSYVTYSDTDGNFWVTAAKAPAFTFPAHTGVRSATDAQLMTGDFDRVGCNQGMCHVGGDDDYPLITIRKDPDEPPPPP